MANYLHEVGHVVNPKQIRRLALIYTITSECFIASLLVSITVDGDPEIVNTEQRSQFTGHIFTSLFEDIESKLSMDGLKGRCKDNIFIERFWRNLK